MKSVKFEQSSLDLSQALDKVLKILVLVATNDICGNLLNLLSGF